MDNKLNDNRFWIGVMLLVLGAVLLIFNLDIFPFDLRHTLKRYFWHWPMILVLIGLIKIFVKNQKQHGLVFLIIGFAFMAQHWFQIPYRFRDIFWPLIFILIGVTILFKGNKGPQPKKEWNCGRRSEDYSDMVDDMAFFSGSEKIIATQNFKGGKLTCIFGGININMLRSKIAPGQNYIEVLAIFGGTKIIVPDDWNIKISVVSIFGGFADKRSIAPTTVVDKERELIIRGMVIFGGGEIRNF